MANARGLREAGFAPGHGPGYETLGEPGLDARGIAEGLASGELSTIWLNYADPVRFFPDRALWERALGTAQTVIAVESVMTETVREHADVVFPGEAYPEKEGTVTNLDGRVQRLRVAIGRPKGRSGMPGSGVRPVWQVISDLGDLGVVTGAAASKQLFDAVPFYAGLTLDEIGGRGIRWPEGVTDWQGLGARRRRGVRRRRGGDGLRLGTYRSLWAAKEVDASPILQFAIPRQVVELSPEDAAALGVREGDRVRGRLQRHAPARHGEAARRRARRLGVHRRGRARRAGEPAHRGARAGRARGRAGRAASRRRCPRRSRPPSKAWPRCRRPRRCRCRRCRRTSDGLRRGRLLRGLVDPAPQGRA